MPTVEITPAQHRRLEAVAQRHGLTPATVLGLVLDLALPQLETRTPDRRGVPLAGFVKLQDVDMS